MFSTSDFDCKMSVFYVSKNGNLNQFVSVYDTHVIQYIQVLPHPTPHYSPPPPPPIHQPCTGQSKLPPLKGEKKIQPLCEHLLNCLGHEHKKQLWFQY